MGFPATVTIAGQEELAERRSPERSVSERVLIAAPTGDDAALVSQILAEAGSEAVALPGLGALAREIEAGAGLLLIASEALEDEQGRESLREVLERQEPWSEIPILLIGGNTDGHPGREVELLGERAHIVLLERPLGVAMFLTAVDAALRSRRRQFEVRRLLSELAASAAAVERAYEEADRAKDEFLATLAHELRSPMTAIRGWIQLLQMGDLDPGETATALEMIEASTKAQAHIVEDLMDVSRILAGKIMIEPERIELAPVLSTVVATFRSSAELQGVEVSAVLPDEPVCVLADEVRLQQVGSNLVSNAIKFTPRGGAVQVTLGTEDGCAVLRFRDSGRGIAPELLPHIFERYRQADGESSKKHRGLGLGLSIVRHLVEIHGGTIEACSDGLGKGAEFVVRLPLAGETR